MKRIPCSPAGYVIGLREGIAPETARPDREGELLGFGNVHLGMECWISPGCAGSAVPGRDTDTSSCTPK